MTLSTFFSILYSAWRLESFPCDYYLFASLDGIFSFKPIPPGPSLRFLVRDPPQFPPSHFYPKCSSQFFFFPFDTLHHTWCFLTWWLKDPPVCPPSHPDNSLNRLSSLLRNKTLWMEAFPTSLEKDCSLAVNCWTPFLVPRSFFVLPRSLFVRRG